MSPAIFQGIGPLELAIVLVIVLLIFGPKRLPSLGKQLGAGMREFKDSITGKGGDDEDEDDDMTPERRRKDASLSSPQGQGEPVDGEVVSEQRR
jgi:sec-independent protein translocase protein TatA